jgi:cyanate permease
MPTWFAIVLTCIAVVIAGIANDPIVWRLTGLLILVIWLFRVLIKREVQSHQEAAKQDVWEDIFTYASSVQQQRSGQPVDRDQDFR